MGLSPLVQAHSAPWFDAFLAPVLERLGRYPRGANLVDIGTGPGRLLELVQDRLEMSATGLDVDPTMLERARERLSDSRTRLVLTEPGSRLPFRDDEFDVACLCSVLFLLDDSGPLVDEALRVVRPGSEVVMLTPTGRGDPADVLASLVQGDRGRLVNSTLFVWRKETERRGREWTNERWLASYAADRSLTYERSTVLHGLAVLETIGT